MNTHAPTPAEIALAEEAKRTRLVLHLPLSALPEYLAVRYLKLAKTLCEQPCRNQGAEPCVKVGSAVALCSQCVTRLLEQVRIDCWRHANTLDLTIEQAAS